MTRKAPKRPTIADCARLLAKVLTEQQALRERIETLEAILATTIQVEGTA